MKELKLQTIDLVSSALRDGRIDRHGARNLVRPWVEEVNPCEPGVEFIAQSIYGFDVAITANGESVHVPCSAGLGYRKSRAEVMDEISAWFSSRG